ncbi:MAG: hypothetical protein ACFFFC_16070 [Candidatus Thorarchaeota archaeon]
MNEDVIEHITKWVKDQKIQCEYGNLIHDGGKDSAIETYEEVIQMLTGMGKKETK